jgi:uridine kinase
MRNGITHVIGIAGGSGSGKSWLARYLKESLGADATVISQDWYYRDQSATPADRREALNFDHPSAIENELLLEHLDRLIEGEPIETPRYQFSTHSRGKQTVAVEPARVVILEGLFVLHEKAILERLTESVFVEVPADVRLVRRLRRDNAERAISTEETLRLYETFARPMHELFIQPSSVNARRVWHPLCEPTFPGRFATCIKQRINP